VATGGREIEIRGELKEYDGRTEIILENASQLGGQAARISPLPKSFDVEQRGHFSAGKFRAPIVALHARKEDVRHCPQTFRRRSSRTENQKILTAEYAKKEPQRTQRKTQRVSLRTLCELCG